MTALKEKLEEKTAVKPAKKDQNIKQMIAAMKPAIEKALPSVITPERFTRMTLSALSNNPKLEACTPKSFLAAMMNAAQLGLEPNTPLGQAYLIPYKNQCQFQIGYKGLIDLAHRSGEFKTISAHAVHKNDEFSYSLGLDADIKHIPKLTDRGEVIAYYAIFKLVNGGYAFEVMSKEDVKVFANDKSQAYNNGPWQTDFDEMAKKTVLKKLLKYAPIKTEFARHVTTDETIKTTLSADMADEPNEIDYIDVETGEVITS